jgi:CRP/FNR family transcriptional regulator, cyclic AMP receptor protein
MTTTDTASCLRGSPLGSGLTDEQIVALAGLFTSRKLQDGELLCKEGDRDEDLHLIASGRLAVERASRGGTPMILHVLHENDIAGEMSFIDGRPHTASLRALGEATICTIGRARFESLIKKDPWLVYQVMRNIVQNVHDILRRMNFQHVEMTNYISGQ